MATSSTTTIKRVAKKTNAVVIDALATIRDIACSIDMDSPLLELSSALDSIHVTLETARKEIIHERKDVQGCLSCFCHNQRKDECGCDCHEHK